MESMESVESMESMEALCAIVFSSVVLFRAEALLHDLTAFPLNWRKTSTNIGLLLGHAVLLPYLSRN
jgi:hypothetical protein